MVNKVDLKILLQNLGTLPEAAPPEYTLGVRYLVDVLVMPLLEDRTVMLDSLDYDRFGQDDLDALFGHLDHTGELIYRLEDLASSLGKLPPCCIPRPIFC